MFEATPIAPHRRQQKKTNEKKKKTPGPTPLFSRALSLYRTSNPRSDIIFYSSSLSVCVCVCVCVCVTRLLRDLQERERERERERDGGRLNGR